MMEDIKNVLKNVNFVMVREMKQLIIVLNVFLI